MGVGYEIYRQNWVLVRVTRFYLNLLDLGFQEFGKYDW